MIPTQTAEPPTAIAHFYSTNRHGGTIPHIDADPNQTNPPAPTRLHDNSSNTPTDPPNAGAKVVPVLEWILPEENQSLVSIWGGGIRGYHLVDEYAIVLMDESWPLILSRSSSRNHAIQLPGRVTSKAQFGRFLFLSIRLCFGHRSCRPNQPSGSCPHKGTGRVSLGEDGQVSF